MTNESARARAMNDTRNRILDVALEVLGRDPDAGMGDIAAGAGLVRRTVYGHFPARDDLIRSIAQRAVGELTTVLADVGAAQGQAEKAWVDFIAHLWPLAHRYRVLVVLRRGRYGAEIHALLAPVDEMLAALVQRGQDDGEFGRHLPAALLSQLASAAVFSIADSDLATGALDAGAATIASLLVLGVPEPRARALAARA